MKQEGSDKIGTEWLSIWQVTQYADVSERTVRAWVHASVDALPAIRVGGKLLVRRSELDSWLGRHRVRLLETIDLDGIVRHALQAVGHGR
ncbi:MAG: helix-turn-helix domain-containing protein [Acidobacteriia bacterium]|nr:helix-turn-helix domain-containing protein [Terriglobia bacterium]